MAKTYLKASAKMKDTQYGQILKIGVKVDELVAFAREHVNSRGYLNLDIVPRKEVGMYGDTHSVALDDYVKGSGQTAPSPRADHSEPVTDDDIPFMWVAPFLLPALMAVHGVIA